MDDLKKGYREVETKVRETGRELDGHSLDDDIGDAGDELRKDMGNAGDDARRAVNGATREAEETANRRR
ncbi:MAG TPA: hypothetical protein VNF73_00615 [Candidatus Saccharimonadales bacterium]|nr:hypothetical protein [Candidatus Saccharimonadales bacterium]